MVEVQTRGSATHNALKGRLLTGETLTLSSPPLPLPLNKLLLFFFSRVFCGGTTGTLGCTNSSTATGERSKGELIPAGFLFQDHIDLSSLTIALPTVPLLLLAFTLVLFDRLASPLAFFVLE